MENIEVKKVRKKRASVFDNHNDEIIRLLKLKLSVPSIYKIIEKKLNCKRNPKSLYLYIKRHLLFSIIECI